MPNEVPYPWTAEAASDALHIALVGQPLGLETGDLEPLLERLGGHPVALAQAAARLETLGVEPLCRAIDEDVAVLDVERVGILADLDALWAGADPPTRSVWIQASAGVWTSSRPELQACVEAGWAVREARGVQLHPLLRRYVRQTAAEAAVHAADATHAAEVTATAGAGWLAAPPTVDRAELRAVLAHPHAPPAARAWAALGLAAWPHPDTPPEAREVRVDEAQELADALEQAALTDAAEVARARVHTDRGGAPPPDHPLGGAYRPVQDALARVTTLRAVGRIDAARQLLQALRPSTSVLGEGWEAARVRALVHLELAAGAIHEARALARDLLVDVPRVAATACHLRGYVALVDGAMAEARRWLVESRRIGPSPWPEASAAWHVLAAEEGQHTPDDAVDVPIARATRALRRVHAACADHDLDRAIHELPGVFQPVAPELTPLVAAAHLRASARIADLRIRLDQGLVLDGSRFRVDGGAWVSLERRGNALRLLRALADAEGPGARQADLVEAVWPGSGLLPEPARNRLYVTIRELRSVGLEGVLVTRDDGYALDGPVTVVRRSTLDSDTSGSRA